MTRIVICIFLWGLVTLPAKSQDTLTVEPEQQVLDGSFIVPYTNQWKVSVIDTAGDKQLVRIWTDYAQILNLDGTDYLHRVQDLYTPAYELEQTWVNVVDSETLVPRRFSSHGTNGAVSFLEFREGKVIQRSGTVQDAFTTSEYDVEHVVYDWNLYGMLLLGLPFEQGNIYKIPFWSQQGQAAGVVAAKIEGKETIQTLSGKNITTTKVTTDKGLAFWLTKEKPYVIQLTLALPNGNTMIWEMM